MDPTKAPPQIFDQDLLRLRRARAQKRNPSFLAQRCAEDAADRLCDVNRTFENALIIGPPEFSETLLDALPPGKRPKVITRSFSTGSSEGLEVTAPDDDLPFSPASFDLVISGLSLHSINDLPGALIAARNLLSPDGLFIGAMFGGETLSELRQSAYSADDAIFGGMSPRVSPFADYSQAAALLQRSGYALPVVDTDRVTVRYKDIQRLFEDIRDLGDMNSLKGRSKAPLTRKWRHSLIKNYTQNFSENGKFVTTFEILWLTGWAPHESQQKPLRPGSAKMRLADALGVKENPVK